MELSITIIIGVVSGIITSAVLFLFASIFKRILIPWYQNIIYKGVALNAKWVLDADEAEIGGAISLHLKQNAHKLFGTAIVSRPEKSDQLFEVKGQVWEGYVSLMLRSTDHTRVSFGNLLLKVCLGGETLSGHFSIKNIREDETNAFAVHLIRAT